MAMADAPSAELHVRRVRFDWLDRETDTWHHEMPEFGAAANAISLLMPHAEPYVIAMVRAGITEGDVDAVLAAEAETLVQQESTHFKAHRDFNLSLCATSSTARKLDRFGAWIFKRLAQRSNAFGLAFAAAFEIVAFCSARWAESGLRAYFGGADERAATLFLWHLAEEIEHKGIAHDVMLAHPTAHKKYKAALVVAFATLIGYTVIGGLSLFCRRVHVFNPMRWIRLIGWGFSFAFVVMPVASASIAKDFHPSQLVDPPWMAMWLSEFDPITKTMPLWTDAGMGRPPVLSDDLDIAA
jgi:predicted metal-dependent hydrolase